MTNPINLNILSVEKLVDRFAEIGVLQDDALLDQDIQRYNDLFKKMQDVVAELKSRPGDQRSALLALYQHANRQVRVRAANNTIDVAPIAARKLLKDISESGWQPQAGDAGMSLWMLDREPTKQS